MKRSRESSDFQPFISVVIPAFNEEKLLERTLSGLLKYLGRHFPSYEVIVVDDGSGDGTSKVVTTIGKVETTEGRVRLLRNDGNRGKGFSVRRGMLASRGKFVFFIDADLPYDPEAFVRMVEFLEAGRSIVIGMRVIIGAEKRTIPPMRYIAGQIFSLLVRFIVIPDIRDTQCGIKGFTADVARKVFMRLTIDGFGFDVETLYIARKLGYSIKPVAVKMTGFRYDSRVQVLRDSLRMLADLFRIRVNDLRGRYDD